MANIAAIYSVGNSLTTYLNRAYGRSPFPAGLTKPECTFTLRSIGDERAQAIVPSDTAVTVLIFLYRASINHHLRNVGRTDSVGRPVPFSVDLHYLFSFWAGSGENEQLALAWTMRELHQTPVLDASLLSRDAAWAPDDVIQLIPEEITNEDMMRIWDALKPDYRLSLSYIARVVRIDAEEISEGRDVVATRFDYAVPAR